MTPGNARRWVIIGTTLAIGGVCGAFFDWQNIPLAWILGPMIATAILSISGLNVLNSARSRRLGQLVIGAGLGLNITTALVVQMGVWVPMMIVTAVLAAIITSFFSVFYARFGGLDRATAFFAMMPGGLSEMANIGAKVGARSEPIALSQAVRIALVVCVLPPAIVALGVSGDFATIDGAPALSYSVTVLLLIGGLAGVWLMQRLGAANPWMLGALLVAAFVSGMGFIEGHVPDLLFNAGQFLLGVAIGARFRRDIIRRLPKLLALSAALTLLITIALFGLSMGISWLSGLDLASAALASSAGGVAEMALTAQALHLNVALILGFHIVRAIMVNAFSVQILNTLTRLRFFDGVESLETAVLGPRR